MKKKTHQLTAIIEREDEMYVASCPELDVVSQGSSVEEAKSNLQEAVELFLESASETEVAGRLHNEIFITRIDVAIGQI
jgi:predicted RNase H-like HicB family nuclease